MGTQKWQFMRIFVNKMLELIFESWVINQPFKLTDFKGEGLRFMDNGLRVCVYRL